MYESIGSEMSKINSADKGETHDRENDIAYGQLGFFAFNMINFNCPMPLVMAIVDKYARFIRMRPEQWEVCVCACVCLRRPV